MCNHRNPENDLYDILYRQRGLFSKIAMQKPSRSAKEVYQQKTPKSPTSPHTFRAQYK